MNILRPGKPRRLVAEFYTQDGKLARVDGSPTWTVDRPDAVELSATADPNTVRAKVVEPVVPGTYTVTCTGDADLGEGVVPVALTQTLTILEPMAVSGAVLVGDEEAEPAPAPAPEPAAEVAPAPAAEPVVVADPVADIPVADPVADIPVENVTADAPASTDPTADPAAGLA